MKRQYYAVFVGILLAIFFVFGQQKIGLAVVAIVGGAGVLALIMEFSHHIFPQHFFQSLETAGGFGLSGDGLTLWYDDGQGALNWVK
ncbi:MAG TPA: hypothetical protein VE136_16565 [Anaerolineales bacterium]|jgi:Flp pilus assembly protein TadB|nr:hypothetical protein [Anaerolineales bacterium]